MQYKNVYAKTGRNYVIAHILFEIPRHYLSGLWTLLVDPRSILSSHMSKWNKAYIFFALFSTYIFFQFLIICSGNFSTAGPAERVITYPVSCLALKSIKFTAYLFYWNICFIESITYKYFRAPNTPNQYVNRFLNDKWY